MRGEDDNTWNSELAMHVMIPAEHRVPESARFTVLHQGRRLMFDHILVSRALLGHLGDVDIHNEALSDEAVVSANSGRALESYHAPIVATFDLPA